MPVSKVVFASLNFSAYNSKLSCSGHIKLCNIANCELHPILRVLYIFYFSGSHPVCTEIIFFDDFWIKGNKVFECRRLYINDKPIHGLYVK